jgi:hypothetical protein
MVSSICAARYSLCVQLHILMAVSDVECVGSFKIVALQDLDVFYPEFSSETVRSWEQARRT